MGYLVSLHTLGMSSMNREGEQVRVDLGTSPAEGIESRQQESSRYNTVLLHMLGTASRHLLRLYWP